MISTIIMLMAAVAVLINSLTLLSVWAVERASDGKSKEYYFLINMSALNVFMAGAVMYGIIYL